MALLQVLSWSLLLSVCAQHLSLNSMECLALELLPAAVAVEPHIQAVRRNAQNSKQFCGKREHAALHSIDYQFLLCGTLQSNLC